MRVITAILGALVVLSLLAGCAPAGVEGRPLPPDVEALLAEEGGAYVVLTLASTLDAALERRLDAAGIVLYDPLGGSQYQAYLPAAAAGALADLQAEAVITKVAAIDPESKLKGDFDDPSETYAVIVHLYAEPTTEISAALDEHMTVLRRGEGVMHFVEGQATGAQIRALIALPYVKAVEAAVSYSSGVWQLLS
jgi:hypothetical protein